MNHRRFSLGALPVFILLGLAFGAGDQSSLGQGTNFPPARQSSSLADDSIIIHFHRADQDYTDENLWTWEKTPAAANPEFFTPESRDEFGDVFVIHRHDYKDQDKIGLLLRRGKDWSHKDGSDKFWTPELGREVWLVSGSNVFYTQKPSTAPHIQAAYIDSPTTLVARLTAAPPGAPVITILDTEGEPLHGSSVATLISAKGPVSDASAAPQLKIVLSHPLDLKRPGYQIKIDGFGPDVPLIPRGILDDRDLYYDANAQLGASLTSKSTTFRLFAPTATSVQVVLYDEATGSKGRSVQPLKAGQKGIWEGTVPGNLTGKFYTYRLDGPDLNPTLEVLDPYATNAVASSSRGRLTEIAHSVPPGPHRASNTDMVVYEMHVRDFSIDPNSGVTARGLYPGFTEAGTHLPGQPEIRTTLDHLTELGVTDVQLLPVQDFQNNEANPVFNWGYIPIAYFSPEGMYASNPNDDSRVREFQALVTALHARGIRVIMDVVYNHTAPDASFDSIVPGYYYRHLADGTLANGSYCGNEFRTEAPMARKLMLDSLKFWVEKYGIDGFRFDFMALLDQASVRAAARELKAIRPDIALYGEPWAAKDSPLVQQTDKSAMRRMMPVGAFNDDYRNALHGDPNGPNPGWIENGSRLDELKHSMLINSWLSSPEQSINYMSCHDNLVLWDKLKLAMPGASDELLKETMKLGYLALMTSQGVPFMLGGGEFARTKGGNDNSYEAPDSVNEIDWSLKARNIDLSNYVRDVIAMRKAHPVFRLRTREEIAHRLRFPAVSVPKTLVYTLDGTNVAGEKWKHVYIALNSNDTADVNLSLPEGSWMKALDEKGACPGVPVSKTITLRHKSGVVIYQP